MLHKDSQRQQMRASYWFSYAITMCLAQLNNTTIKVHFLLQTDLNAQTAAAAKAILRTHPIRKGFAH